MKRYGSKCSPQVDQWRLMAIQSEVRRTVAEFEMGYLNSVFCRRFLSARVRAF
jgi:hypothetical protein